MLTATTSELDGINKRVKETLARSEGTVVLKTQNWAGGGIPKFREGELFKTSWTAV